MSVLKIRTQDQLIFIEKPVPILTSGNQNNDVLQVTFDETWDCENGVFYASFYIDNPNNAYIIPLTRNEDDSFTCMIPEGVLWKEGAFNLGVWCEFEDKRKTSSNKEIEVYQGAVTNSTPPAEPDTGGGSSGNVDLSDYAKKDEIPTKTSQLENDSGFITEEDLPENVKGINNMYTYSQDISLEGDQDSKVSVAVNYTDGTTGYFDFTVTNGKDGADGKDYVLTEEDKNEIADTIVDMFGTSLLSIIGTGVVE